MSPLRLSLNALLLGFTLALGLMLASCTSDMNRAIGQDLIEEGRYEEGLAKLQQAVNANPRDATLRIALTSGKARVVKTLLTKADSERSQRDFNSAAIDYSRVIAIEPSNGRARDALYLLEQMRNINDMLIKGQTSLRRGDLTGAEHEARQEIGRAHV